MAVPYRPAAGLGGPLVALSLAGLIAMGALGGQPAFWHPIAHWLPPGYSAYDYLLGAIVALLIVGLANVQLPVPGVRLARAARGLAGTTFGLYLLHYPLLNFFGTVVPGPPDGAMHRLLVFALALSGALGLARLIEPRKRALRRGLRAALDAVIGKRRPPALERHGLL